MPSWEIHNEIAVLLGFDRVSSELVNRLIDDTDYVHDLGRRVPRLGIKMMFFDPERFVKKSTDLALKLLKLSRHPDLFYLHHALDLLALRMASAILIGCDIRDRKDCVIEGVKHDLNELDYKLRKMVRDLPSAEIPIYRREWLVEKLRNNYQKIVGMPGFVGWVKEKIVDRRVEEDKQEIGHAVKLLWERSFRATEGWSPEWIPNTLYNRKLVEEVKAAVRARRSLGIFFHEVNKLAARRSRLFDYVLVYGSDALSTISEKLLRSNRGLGKEVKRAILEGEPTPDRVREIVSQNWVISGLKEIPPGVIDTYVGLLLEAAPIMKTYLGGGDDM